MSVREGFVCENVNFRSSGTHAQGHRGWAVQRTHPQGHKVLPDRFSERRPQCTSRGGVCGSRVRSARPARGGVAALRGGHSGGRVGASRGLSGRTSPATGGTEQLGMCESLLAFSTRLCRFLILSSRRIVGVLCALGTLACQRHRRGLANIVPRRLPSRPLTTAGLSQAFRCETPLSGFPSLVLLVPRLRVPCLVEVDPKNFLLHFFLKVEVYDLRLVTRCETHITVGLVGGRPLPVETRLPQLCGKATGPLSRSVWLPRPPHGPVRLRTRSATQLDPCSFPRDLHTG